MLELRIFARAMIAITGKIWPRCGDGLTQVAVYPE
jgi:hypothetical protein